MSPETIRRRAIECMQLAKNKGDPPHRALLLDLAHCWANLANAMERYQLFAEAAEARSAGRAARKARPRNSRAARPPRRRTGSDRLSPHARRRALQKVERSSTRPLKSNKIQA